MICGCARCRYMLCFLAWLPRGGRKPQGHPPVPPWEAWEATGAPAGAPRGRPPVSPWLPGVPRAAKDPVASLQPKQCVRDYVYSLLYATVLYIDTGQKKAATKATLKRHSHFLRHIDMLLVLFLLRSRQTRRAQQPSLQNRNPNGCNTDPLLAHPLHRRVRRAVASATAIRHHSPVVNAPSPTGHVDRHSVPSPPPRSSPSPRPTKRDRAPCETSHFAA